MTTDIDEWSDRWLHRSTTDAIEERILRSIGELEWILQHDPVFDASTYGIAIDRLRAAFSAVAVLRIEP